jgi:hypothetical protein
MKYIQTYHISCLYPHLLLTFIKVHTHEDIYSRIHKRGILPKSLILSELGIIIPSPLGTHTIVGIPRPFLFSRGCKLLKLFLWLSVFSL